MQVRTIEELCIARWRKPKTFSIALQDLGTRRLERWGPHCNANVENQHSREICYAMLLLCFTAFGNPITALYIIQSKKWKRREATTVQHCIALHWSRTIGKFCIARRKIPYCLAGFTYKAKVREEGGVHRPTLHCIELHGIATLHFIAGVEYKAKVREERDVDLLTLHCIALHWIAYITLHCRS